MGTPQGGWASPPGPRPWVWACSEARGRAQGAGAWRLEKGGLLPSRDSRGVCVCASVWVGGYVHICMHVCVHMCLCVCLHVCVARAGQLGASCPRTLWTLRAGGAGAPPRQAWDKTQRAHPCSGHPSPLQAEIRLEGTVGATETPSQGPPVQGLRCSRTPGQPRPSQGRAPHPKRLLLVQLYVLASSEAVEVGGGC